MVVVPGSWKDAAGPAGLPSIFTDQTSGDVVDVELIGIIGEHNAFSGLIGKRIVRCSRNTKSVDHDQALCSRIKACDPSRALPPRERHETARSHSVEVK